MKTWREFLAEVNIEFNEIHKDTTFYTVLKNGNYKKEEIVNFALIAAELVFDIIDNPDLSKAAKGGIDLVKQWLHNPKLVNASTLGTTARHIWDITVDAENNNNDIYNYTGLDAAYTAAYMTFSAAYSFSKDSITTISSYASDAANSAENAGRDHDIDVRGILIQYLHSIDKDHENSFNNSNNQNTLNGFIEDLLVNEPMNEKQTKIAIFLDFLKDEYDIENLDKLGHFSIDPNDPRSIYRNLQSLRNFIRLIQNRVK